MADLQHDRLPSLEPTPRRRAPTRRQRLGAIALGAISGGVAGWITVRVAGVESILSWWIITGLAALSASFGYRYGVRVVPATFSALLDASDD